jgi:hypothetical protein
VNGVLFYRSEGLTKRFTVGEILAGESMASSSQQTNIKSFFEKQSSAKSGQ